jgi:hypothetical protein
MTNIFSLRYGSGQIQPLKMHSIGLRFFLFLLPFFSIYKGTEAKVSRRGNHNLIRDDGRTRHSYSPLHPIRPRVGTNKLESRDSLNDTFILWATHSSGKIFTLMFIDYWNGTTTLDVIQEIDNTCGRPSFLFKTGIRETDYSLYCFDSTYEDTNGNPANGSITVYNIGYHTGFLTELFKIETLPGPVSATTYIPRFGPSTPNMTTHIVMAH